MYIWSYTYKISKESNINKKQRRKSNIKTRNKMINYTFVIQPNSQRIDLIDAIKFILDFNEELS